MAVASAAMAKHKYRISFDIHPEVGHSLDLDEKVFSRITSLVKHRPSRDHNGIMEYLSLSDVHQLVNSFTNPDGNKENEPELIRGILKDGISGEHQTTHPDYLPFDIDVKSLKKGDKKDENAGLYDELINESIFEAMERIAVITWRSNSGRGIAGFLHVPNIGKLSEKDKNDYLAAGKVVYRQVNAYIKTFYPTAPNIDFDPAQAKSRQVRYVADQKGVERHINPEPVSFNIREVFRDYEYIEEGIELYVGENGRAVGSIEGKFNEANPIDEALLRAGFKRVGRDRYLHPITSGGSTGAIYDGKFKVFCTDYHQHAPMLDSFGLIAHAKDMTPAQFRQHLIGEGWTDDSLDLQRVQRMLDEAESNEDVYHAAQQLKHLTYQDREKYFNKLRVKDSLRRAFEAYLGFSKYDIEYDTVLNLEKGKWVGDIMPSILQKIEENERLAICADTGTGKTTALLDYYLEKTEKRVLFIAPLSVIVRQQGAKYNDHPETVWLTSDAQQGARRAVRFKRVTIATPQQAVKVLRANSPYDIIIKDEIHSDISTQTYRKDAYAELNDAIDLWANHRTTRIIGLTGTAIPEMRNLGYHLLKVNQERDPNMVEQRITNQDPLQLLIYHQERVKGKAIYRINEKSTIERFRDYLLMNGYKDEQVVILKSELKGSEDYELLVHEGRFRDEVQVVITTSLIDEGLSIYQTGFTDVVYMDSRMEYSPRPEPLKQFLNRFRTEDPKRKLYYYRHKKKDQSPSTYVNHYKDNLSYLENKDNDKRSAAFFNSLSLDNFFYDSGEVNEYYLSFHESQQFFNSLNLMEFNHYTERNFNIRFDLVEWHIEKEERKDLKHLKGISKKNKAELSDFCKEYLMSGMIEAVLIEASPDRKLRANLEDEGYQKGDYDDVVKVVVPKEPKTFSTIINNKRAIEQLGFDAEKYLFNDKGLLEDDRRVKAKIRLMQNIMTIENEDDLNESEAEERKNLIKFVEAIGKKERLDRVDVLAEWKKYFKLKQTKNTQSAAIINLVEHYTDWRYNDKKSHFRKDAEKRTMLFDEKRRIPKKVLQLTLNLHDDGEERISA